MGFTMPIERSRPTITTCKVNGVVCKYDRAANDIADYDDTPNRDEFEYIGEGVIWEVDGVFQGAAEKIHFWRRKTTSK